MDGNRAFEIVNSIIIVLFIAVIPAAVVGVIGYVVYYYLLRGILARSRCVNAMVMRKHMREYDLDMPVSGSGSRLIYPKGYPVERKFGNSDLSFGSTSDFFIVFHIDGKEQEFQVPETVYVKSDVGDIGLLVYKGTLFKQFIIRVKAKI